MTNTFTNTFVKTFTNPFMGDSDDGAFDYPDLFPDGNEKGILWLARDLSSQFQNSTGTIPVTASNQDIGRINDLSNADKDHDALQTTDANRPKIQIESDVYSWQSDGIVQNVEATFLAGDLSSDCSVFISVKTTDASAVIIEGQDMGKYIFASESGSSSILITLGAGSPTIYIDNALFSGTTRDQFNTAISDDIWHIVELRNADLSAWNKLGLSNYAGQALAGRIGHTIVVETGPVLTANRDELIALMRIHLGI